MRHTSPIFRAAIAAMLILSPIAAVAQDAPPLRGDGPEEAAEAALEAAVSSAVNLNITPRRVTLDRQTRTATVYIFNQGDTAMTFNVALVDRIMLPSGEIRAAADAAETPEIQPYADRLRSAADFVVATPRRITLAPGSGQTVRLRANPPPDTDAGEYRTHLTVTSIPPPDAGLTAEQAASEAAGELVFRIQSIFGLSIPVIVRTGPPDVAARIENVALVQTDEAEPALGFEVVRGGASSVFGNIEIHGSGESEPLGVARGLGVYPEIERRSAQIVLRRAPRPGETLNIVFTDDDTDPGRELARASFTAS